MTIVSSNTNTKTGPAHIGAFEASGSSPPDATLLVELGATLACAQATLGRRRPRIRQARADLVRAQGLILEALVDGEQA